LINATVSLTSAVDRAMTTTAAASAARLNAIARTQAPARTRH
jgi:hypothetical protein